MIAILMTAFLLLGVWVGSAQATATLVLSPHNDGASAGFGYQGLYLGGNFNSNQTHPYTNWAWDNVTMQVASNGDATISGTMTRAYNNEVWGLSIMLQDAEIRHEGGLYEAGGDYSGAISPEMLTALSAGIDPITGEDNSGVGGWGLEWKNLSMTLNKMGNNSSVPETGWEGMAMPEIGHFLVAELHYDGPGNGLTFDAWYQNEYTSSWYDVGDTKAQAALMGPIGSAEVPESGTLGVFLFGALGLVYVRRREKKTV